MPELISGGEEKREGRLRRSSSLSQICNPERGPRLLFFSGGTALRDTARELLCYTHNSIHLITPFDSGGSSATLRKAFAMPAVGDLRSRIMALADAKRVGHSEIYTLFAYRLADEDQPSLMRELSSLSEGRHPLLRQIPEPMQGIIREHLRCFERAMPPDFPLAGANVGNLVLTAGYLMHDRRLRPIIALYSRMLQARGVVRPIVEKPAHLAVRLANGETIVGQHRFTGKETACITSPIVDIWLTASEDSTQPVEVAIHRNTVETIAKADLVCYPVGSFYSSVAANLLPKGVGRAIASTGCPKVFVPNLGRDPELEGHTVKMQVERLLSLLKADAPEAEERDLLNVVLVDADDGRYPSELPRRWLAKKGIHMTSRPLVRRGKGPLADAGLLAAALTGLASGCGLP